MNIEPIAESLSRSLTEHFGALGPSFRSSPSERHAWLADPHVYELDPSEMDFIQRTSKRIPRALRHSLGESPETLWKISGPRSELDEFMKLPNADPSVPTFMRLDFLLGSTSTEPSRLYLVDINLMPTMLGTTLALDYALRRATPPDTPTAIVNIKRAVDAMLEGQPPERDPVQIVARAGHSASDDLRLLKEFLEPHLPTGRSLTLRSLTAVDTTANIRRQYRRFSKTTNPNFALDEERAYDALLELRLQGKVHPVPDHLMFLESHGWAAMWPASGALGREWRDVFPRTTLVPRSGLDIEQLLARVQEGPHGVVIKRLDSTGGHEMVHVGPRDKSGIELAMERVNVRSDVGWIIQDRVAAPTSASYAPDPLKVAVFVVNGSPIGGHVVSHIDGHHLLGGLIKPSGEPW